MLYDTTRKDLLPHIMAGRSARSRAWTGFFSALFGGRKAHDRDHDQPTPHKGDALHA